MDNEDKVLGKVICKDGREYTVWAISEFPEFKDAYKARYTDENTYNSHHISYAPGNKSFCLFDMRFAPRDEFLTNDDVKQKVTRVYKKVLSLDNSVFPVRSGIGGDTVSLCSFNVLDKNIRALAKLAYNELSILWLHKPEYGYYVYDINSGDSVILPCWYRVPLKPQIKIITKEPTIRLEGDILRNILEEKL